MKLWGKVLLDTQILKRFGKIRYCVDGIWQGKRIRIYRYMGVVPCESEAQAIQLQITITDEIAKGIFNPERYKKSRPLHLAKYSQKWLEQVRPTLAYSTYKAYRAYFRHHINPILGEKFLPDISYIDYRNLWTSLTVAPKTRKNILTCLYKLMRDARRAGHIAQEPEKLEFRGAFAVEKKAIKWLDRSTQEAILAEIPTDDRYIFRFIFSTGVRVSEARALRKQDIYDEYIVIRHTFAPCPKERGGGEELKIVKQKREQPIPILPETRKVLEEIPKRLDTDFVFINPRTNRPYSKNINRDIWNPACRKVLGYVVPLNNAGRHSFASQLRTMGLDLDTIQKLLRHSDRRVTDQHYADIDVGSLAKKVAQIKRYPK